MSLAIISPSRDISPWLEIFKKEAPDISLEIYPEIRHPNEVTVAMVWQHPKGTLAQFKNLRLICSMGAGVDHILGDENIDKSIAICRIVDPKLTFSMTNYVVMGVLNYHRQIQRFLADKENQKWDMNQPELPVKIGVLGVGELGGDVLDKLDYMGFEVLGYGNRPKKNFKFPYFYGDQLGEFLKQINVLVCLLPLTPQTDGVLNADLFRKCNKGTYLINVARGQHLIEEDLIPAIDEGILSGALLDVFRKEPLPEGHEFWRHPKITFTPHIASVTNPKAAAPQIIENYRRLKENRPLVNQIDRERGY
ncbi:glyoxylate/hydroxypyruvate reductase A [Echinicola marina]|uniref:2-hydroxyacid dehydrogenase n=1 Tax=Echinicola marina TaxID=2859768 RepID=UPI001CF66D4B|nr:glyoxylate/hydroxypyruvate reductase A [Echinicola marina]UCS92649.1 glyoxylate/hydroxypyruvate reductase A [Echinicola marina]